MKRIIVIAVACAFAQLASAQVYKSIGPDGKPVYSDQPPANADAKALNVQPPAPPAQKTAVERDKEAEKSRAQAREKAKKAEETARYNEANSSRCAQAKVEYQTFVEGGRIARVNDKGERVLLGDAEIESERVRTRSVMEEACKK